MTDEHFSVGLGRDKFMIDNILSPEIWSALSRNDSNFVAISF